MKVIVFMTMVLAQFHLRGSEARQLIPGDEPTVWVNEGHINLGYLANVRSSGNPYLGPCKGKVVHFLLHLVETMAMAVGEMNARADILPNITLGFVMVDGCSTTVKGVARSTYFIPDVPQGFESSCPVNISNDLSEKQRHFDVVGIVGPLYSFQAVQVASLMSVFEIPVMSESATTDELSNKQKYEYFMRVVPPDRFVASAIVDIIVKFGWEYIIILYAENTYSNNLGKETEKLLKTTDVCIAFSYRMLDAADEKDYDWLTNKLIQTKKARIIVSFLNSRKILRRLRQKGMKNHFLLLTGDDFFSIARRPEADMVEGSIYVIAHQNPLKRYIEYIEQRKPWGFAPNPWLKDVWANGYHCSWTTNNQTNNSCFQYESISQMPGYSSPSTSSFLSRVYDAVLVYADALDRLLKDECPDVFQHPSKARACVKGSVLLKYLRNTNINGMNGKITFDESGDIKAEYDVIQIQRDLVNGGFVNVVVGRWSMLSDDGLIINNETISFSSFKGANDTISTQNMHGYGLSSVCSKPCPPKQIVIEDEMQCCWKCLPCRVNERVGDNLTDCIKCEPYTWPDQSTATVCHLIDATYLKLNSPLGICIAILAFLGALLSLLISVIIHKNRRHKLIRATSRELSSMILVGTLLASLDAFLMVTAPTKMLCTCRRSLFHASVCLMYAPMLVKTTRIYRIFVEAKKGNQKLRFISSSLQMMIALMITAGQIFLLLAMETYTPSTVSYRMPIPTEKYSEIYCHQDLFGFLVPLSFNVLIVLVCAILGYLCRKLPENFNESWHIFLMVATTLFMWMVFIPTYFTTFYAYFQALLLSLCLLLNAYITICCLFVPRIYAVSFVSLDQLTVVPMATGSVSVNPTALNVGVSTT